MHDIGEPSSPKSYGAAVALCGVFGVVGIHHFYIGNYLHGVVDLLLFITGFSCVLFSEDPAIIRLGIVLILADVIHTGVIMYLLLVGKQRDGNDLLIRYPGQK